VGEEFSQGGCERGGRVLGELDPLDELGEAGCLDVGGVSAEEREGRDEVRGCFAG